MQTLLNTLKSLHTPDRARQARTRWSRRVQSSHYQPTPILCCRLNRQRLRTHHHQFAGRIQQYTCPTDCGSMTDRNLRHAGAFDSGGIGSDGLAGYGSDLRKYGCGVRAWIDGRRAIEQVRGWVQGHDCAGKCHGLARGKPSLG